MSTFTTRFIFPMVSLEGRRFWFLAMLPLRRETILWSKFVFALGGSALPCSALILLSDLVLGVPLLIVGVHQLTCLLLCLGLSGIAVGLGARLPNLREESPSRIAAGFGGTLNLVASTLYVLVIVVLTAMPFHFYLAADASRAGSLPHVTRDRPLVAPRMDDRRHGDEHCHQSGGDDSAFADRLSRLSQLGVLNGRDPTRGGRRILRTHPLRGWMY